MPVEAEWDPITCKVIYRRDSVDDVPLTENHPPNQTSVEDDKTVSKASTSIDRRRSRSKTRKSKPSVSDWRKDEQLSENPIRKSMGIAPQSFHASTEAATDLPEFKKLGQPYVQKLHALAQQRNMEQQTAARRQELSAQRHAFSELTEYRTFPLQIRAIRHCRQLQMDWGLSSDQLYEETGSAETDNCPAGTVDTQSSSSASSSSSLEAPDRKRLIRGKVACPSQSRVLHHHNLFLKERKIRPNEIAATQLSDQSPFGTALYSLEPRIFAIETKKSAPLTSHLSAAITAPSSEGSRRRYVVAHVGRFMDKYWCRTEPAWRHAYEVIPPSTPCRLYLDIECTDHPDLIGMSSETRALQEQVLSDLFLELVDELREQYASLLLQCSNTKCSYKLQQLQRRDIVDLDSSTDTKFSRHWIVHVPVICCSRDDSDDNSPYYSEALFTDAAAVGVFVRQWIGRLAEQQATDQLLKNDRAALYKYLFVPKKPKSVTEPSSAVDQTRCLVDLGVYTRNRLFRLLGSTKFGKPGTAALRIAEANEFRFAEAFGNHCFFMPQMPTKHSPRVEEVSLSVDDIESKIQKSLSKTDWIPHASSLAETFVVPLNVAKIDYPILPGSVLEARSLPPKFSRTLGLNSNLSFGKSPYPMVDEFVQSHLAIRGGTQGLIRAWSILRSSDSNVPLVISYQMIRNRWCECVGREHKSNNISWNCDLVLFHCYQTCYDPDCRSLNFRGTPVALPLSVQEELRDALFEEALARLDITGSSQPPAQVTNVPHHPVPTEHFENDSSFESALASLNLAESRSTSNFASTVITDVYDTTQFAGDVNETAVESAMKSMKPPEMSIQQVLLKNKQNDSYASSSDESDIDLVALARKKEQQLTENSNRS